MLSRRLFLGTTAGAAGLFGFFGRLRFRPQRRGRLIGVLIKGDGATLRVDQGETPRVFVHFRGEETARELETGDGEHFLMRWDSLRDVCMYCRVTVRRDDHGQWHPVSALVTTDERAFTHQTAMINYGFRDYGLPGFGRFANAPKCQSVVPIFA